MDVLTTLEIVRRAGGVAEIRMSRPDVFNAFDEVMIGELAHVFGELATDPAIRVVVLAGVGRHFSAGADLHWMQRAAAATREWNVHDSRRFAAMLSTIDRCPKPTIARVQGAALGGGVGLVCACDVAIAAHESHFAISEVRFGILPAAIGPYLVNAVGPRHARRLALSATRIDAAEALAIGLVHQTVPLADLDAAIETTVREMLQGGPHAQREVKDLYAVLEVGAVTSDVRELTAQTISRVRGGNEAREGFAAFLAKRRPGWDPSDED